MMRMAAIYARVSQRTQREEKTIASQTASLIEFCQEPRSGSTRQSGVFEDDGYSGAYAGAARLGAACAIWPAEGQIQTVLRLFPDRLSGSIYQIC